MTNEELVALIQAGERDRLPELWDQVERFVARQANRLLITMGDRAAAHGLEFNDLYNSGYVALVAAADSYGPEAGALFITWFAMHLKTAFAETGGWRTSKRDPLTKSTSLDAPINVGDEEAVIRARYYQGRTLEEIGPQARTLESHALVKLRKPRVRRELEQYIERRTPYYMTVGVQTFQNTGESAVERIVFLREQMRSRKGLAV